eukprot:m.1533936 g.1533936  ORF g.1533936 m.1533936 type:complete len:87 (+) comp25243_c0_seq29:4453-4713(+)
MPSSLPAASLGIGGTSMEGSFGFGSGIGRKSVSRERTFREINEPEALRDKCKQICEKVASDLERLELEGKTVTLKLKTVTFEVRPW